ncbi:EamA family transporter [Fodinisporobacter ferrooxydans]|uniref:EamA family transporter n=2 Tax=Fodinisporobacter ferrooxydans TaxID=2901836 RepID=A0ABY4CU72_9BACL|nr:EamA family transporter [Alicyclobacillaceae bacterium MYW30-H2]
MIMVLIGAILWGVSGTAAQVLFQNNGFQPAWLVTVRMGLSGLILVLFSMIGAGTQKTFVIWKRPKDVLYLVVFAVIGLIGVQYSFFVTIALSNAATATILQYLGPVAITLYLALRLRRMPNRWESLAVVLAFVGTCLLITDGRWNAISISPGAVSWGLISALALAFYTMFPQKLIKQYGSAIIVGWAMLIGSVLLSFVTHPWRLQGTWSYWALELVTFVVLFGTLVAFYLYLESLRYITPSETSLLGCAEPLSSAFVAMMFLHVRLGLIAWIGAFCILATVVILSRKSAGR